MIAKGAGIPLAVLTLPSLLFVSLNALTGYTLFFYLFLLFLALPIFSLYFFRNPKRRITGGIVCPADGRVAVVKDHSFDIFMGVTNVHVNRSPVSGKVISQTHHPGTHRPAYHDDIEGNERMETEVECLHGTVRITQLAGIIARRIVPYVSPGDEVKAGQPIGMIRFGSRVRVELPESAVVQISVGDVVRAGETKVGEWR